jgi:hypothetical protein
MIVARCLAAIVADAHSHIGLGKVFIGRSEEAKAHIIEALRLSPRDTTAYAWMTVAGVAKNHLGDHESRRSYGAGARSAPIATIPTPVFTWPSPTPASAGAVCWRALHLHLGRNCDPGHRHRVKAQLLSFFFPIPGVALVVIPGGEPPIVGEAPGS